MKLSEYYIKRYAKNLDQESIKNERKKVKNLVEKLKKTPDIFGGLSLDYLRVEEQAKLLHFFLEECEHREVVNNLKKTNVDVDFSFLQLAEQCSVVSVAADYQPIRMDKCIFQVRDIIRSQKYEDKELLERLSDLDNKLFQELTGDYDLHKSIGIKLEWPQYVEGYIDYILNGLLQFLVYRIITNRPQDTVLEVISKLTSKADFFIGEFERVREKTYLNADWIENLNADRVLQYFRFFITHRNRVFENSDIYTILIKEMEKYPELFQEVSEEYRADKILLTDEQICSKTVQNIITENDNVPNYRNKLATARKFITVMQKYARRNCYDNCLQDIKVYFREIYLSKQTYHRQKSSKIVEDYLKKLKKAEEEGGGLPDFQKESQYIFIREKISRGYFREKNLSKAYADKCELTEKVDNLLLKAYWLADSFSAIELLHTYYQELIKCLDAIL